MRRIDPALLLPALLAALVSSCHVLEPEVPARRTLLVHDHPVECSGVALQLCLQVRAPEQTELGWFHDGIEGFEYEWGYRYEIEVEEQPVHDPPADGPSARTILLRERAKTPVAQGTEFEMVATAGERRIEEVAPDRYRLHDAAEFVCADGGRCAELRTRIAAGARIRYTFRHAATPGEPLTIVRWEACERPPGGAPGCRS